MPALKRLRWRAHFLTADPVMHSLARAAGALALEPAMTRSPFESLARAISHQQLNGVVADRILGRFIDLLGDGAFPTPQAVLAAPPEALRGVGYSWAKIASLRDMAEKALSGIVPASEVLHALDDARIIERLTQVRGIGRWTVEMLLIFQLGRPDVLPADDYGVRNGFRLAYRLRGLPTPRALAAFGERWAPYRSIAAWYLWRAVDLSRADRLPPAPAGRPPRVAIVTPREPGPSRPPRVAATRTRRSLRKAIVPSVRR